MIGKGSDGLTSDKACRVDMLVPDCIALATTHTVCPRNLYCEAADVVPIWLGKHSTSNGGGRNKAKVKPIWWHWTFLSQAGKVLGWVVVSNTGEVIISHGFSRFNILGNMLIGSMVWIKKISAAFGIGCSQ